MTDPVRVTVHQAEVDRLLRSPAVTDLLLDAGRDVAAEAARNAPRDTGRGAASIHPELVTEDGTVTVHVSWDRDRFYMAFHEFGTVHLPARPFLEPALDQYARF